MVPLGDYICAYISPKLIFSGVTRKSVTDNIYIPASIVQPAYNVISV